MSPAMGRRLELRDLRSLERRSMYSIYHPLDVNERLPRELMLEGRRKRIIDSNRFQLAGVLYLPALMLALVVMGSVGVNELVEFGVCGLLLVGSFIFALTGKCR